MRVVLDCCEFYCDAPVSGETFSEITLYALRGTLTRSVVLVVDIQSINDFNGIAADMLD